MYTYMDENEIFFLRIARWLLVRLTLLIILINAINHLNNGKIPRGIIELIISAGLVAVDIFVIGRAIRKRKKRMNDPEYLEKQRNMSPVENMRREAVLTIVIGIVCLLVCFGLFIIVPIVIHVNDLVRSLILGAFLTLVGALPLIFGIRAYKDPMAVIKRREKKHPVTSRRATLYKDFELGFEPARKQYCRQTGKSDAELTNDDEQMIWEYAYAQITYLFAWIAEHRFYRAAESDSPYLAELVGKIKAREILPSSYIAENDGTLFEDNIKESAIGFVKEYMNNSEYVNGHEVAKKGDIIGAYYPEVEAFAKEHLNAEMFGFPFRWEDYDAFKVHIDEAYSKYKAKHAVSKKKA